MLKDFFYWRAEAAKVMAYLMFGLMMIYRYFFISFLIILLVLPTFSYSQSKIESKIIGEDETTKGRSESETPSRQFILREHKIGQDAIDVLKLSGTGFLNQFTNWDSVLLLGATGGVTYMLSLDEMHQQQVIQRANIMGKYGQKAGDINGWIINIPIIQVGGYFLGRATNNEKLTQFSMDVTATHMLVLLEVGAISQIPFHKRPNIERGLESERSGGINNVLRGVSSFPSGHMVGVSVLMFKGWEYYGWRAGIPATIATALIGWARIEAGEHYLTDIFGAVALSGIASLSTSRRFDIVTRGITTSDGGRLVVRPIIGTNNMGVSVTRTF